MVRVSTGLLVGLAVVLVACSSNPSGGPPDSGTGPGADRTPDGGHEDATGFDQGSADGQGVPEDVAADRAAHDAADAPGSGTDADGGLADGNGTGIDAGLTTRTCVPPASVLDPLVISGTISQVGTSGGAAASGATVEIVSDADGTVLATATTLADGTYTLPGVATGGRPLAAHARVTQSGFVTTLFYVVDGLRTGRLSTGVYEAAIHRGAAAAAGVEWNPANGIVNVSVRMCNDGSPSAGLAGATVSVVPGSTTEYDDGRGNPVTGGTATRASSGNAFDFNVPPGTSMVNLVYQGALTAYPVVAEAGAYTMLLDFP